MADLEPEIIDRLDEALRQEVSEPLTADALGPEPTKLERVATALWQSSRRNAQRSDIRRVSLSTAKVLANTGIRKEELDEWLRQGLVAAIESVDGLVFPDWQFSQSGEVLPGVAELIAVFPMSVEALSLWVVHKSELLNGETPAQLLRVGDWEKVVVAAQVASVATS